MQQELALQVEGAAPRDLASYSAWRRDARPENVAALNFYAEYLVNQYAGMGTALNLEAVRAALDIEGVPRHLWAEVTRRMQIVHGGVVKHVEAKKP